MKKYTLATTAVWILSLMFSIHIGAQDIPEEGTGLPGDHFSLEGALKVFKESKSLEDFEKKLNQKDNYVNNLDLDEDGKTDYVRVIDHMENDVHAITLNVAISKKESQDIAVIEIEKNGAESAILQIVGDEDIYGENVIVEPYEEEGSGNKGGPEEAATIRLVVNVWFWSPIRFIYSPRYVVWSSPWRWGYYPPWWRPWRPHPWHVYHPHRVRFHVGFHVVSTHRVVRAHRVYAPRRSTSVVVRTRYSANVTSYRTKNKVVKNNTISTRTVNTRQSVSTKTTKSVTATKGNKSITASSTTKKAAARSGNNRGAAVKSTKTVKASNGNKTIKGSKTTQKAAGTNGKTKAAAGKSTKSVRASGNKGSVKASKSTQKAGAKRGKTSVKARKTTTKVKRKKN